MGQGMVGMGMSMGPGQGGPGPGLALGQHISPPGSAANWELPQPGPELQMDRSRMMPGPGPSLERPTPMMGGGGGFSAERDYDAPTSTSSVPPTNPSAPPTKVNEVEILVYGSSPQLAYAEVIEKHIREVMGLNVDILFPKEDAKVKFTVAQFLENISYAGTSFAIIIRPDNMSHHSVTMHVLKGVLKPEEHRNMPIEQCYIKIREKLADIRRTEFTHMPANIKGHLALMLDNRSLTDSEYMAILRFIHQRWEKQRLLENRTDYDPGTGISTQEQLKLRILKILGLGVDPSTLVNRIN